jgi:hypothetical protein
MKPHFATLWLRCAVLGAACALAAGSALAQASASDAVPAKPAAMDANEAAGLPNLDEINRPNERGTASATVDLNVPRTPSFHETSPTGTEITEYRDTGKPTEIDVHSGFGTHYQMTAPTDASPRVTNDGPADNRLPSIKLSY